MSDIWHKLLHMALHTAGHAIHQYSHKQHQRAEAERERAHRLSGFAGSVYDACNEAGFEVVNLEPLFAAYLFRGRVVCLGCDEDGYGCYAPTQFKFYSRVPHEVAQFLENRSASLKYGAWRIPRVENHYSVMFRVAVEPAAMDDELFRFATEYAFSERAEVEEILFRAGYKPS